MLAVLTFGAALTDLVPFLRTLVAIRGAVYALALARRERRARESFICGNGQWVSRGINLGFINHG